MRVLLFDPFNGAAGDMIIASLLALGADQAKVTGAMASVVEQPSIEWVDRCGIRAVRVETNATAVHRNLDEVIARVREAVADERVREMAERVFWRLHRAEESVHGRHDHFHEVGADDAVADVVGACTALISLNPDHVAVGPVHLGRGMVESAHGIYPVPAPATLAILREAGLTMVPGNEERELCTPTGAALLAEFSSVSPAAIGEGRIEAVGYGAGRRNPPHTPNVLRAVLITAGTDESRKDQVDILETNVDDVTGEVLAHAIARLMDEGARDASAAPLIMKKGRGGYLVRVICAPADAERLAGIMAGELGTLGIRHLSSVHRFILERTVETIQIELNGVPCTVDAKVGWMGRKPVSVKAEFEQTKECAEKCGLPLRDVASAVVDAAWRQLRERDAVK